MANSAAEIIDDIDIPEDWENQIEGEIKVEGSNYARSFDLLIEQPLFVASDKYFNDAGNANVSSVWEGVAVVPKNGEDYSDGYEYAEDDSPKKIMQSIGSKLDTIIDEGMSVEGVDDKGNQIQSFHTSTVYGRLMDNLKKKNLPGCMTWLFGLFKLKKSQSGFDQNTWQGCIVRVGPERYKGMDGSEKTRDRVVGVVGWDPVVVYKGKGDIPVPSCEEIMADFNDPEAAKKKESEKLAAARNEARNAKKDATAGPVRPTRTAQAETKEAPTAATPVKSAAKVVPGPSRKQKDAEPQEIKEVAKEAVKAPEKAAAAVATAAKGKKRLTNFKPEVEAQLVEMAKGAESFRVFRTAFLDTDELADIPEVMAWAVLSANYDALKTAE